MADQRKKLTTEEYLVMLSAQVHALSITIPIIINSLVRDDELRAELAHNIRVFSLAAADNPLASEAFRSEVQKTMRDLAELLVAKE